MVLCIVSKKYGNSSFCYLPCKSENNLHMIYRKPNNDQAQLLLLSDLLQDLLKSILTFKKQIIYLLMGHVVCEKYGKHHISTSLAGHKEGSGVLRKLGSYHYVFIKKEPSIYMLLNLASNPPVKYALRL